MFFLVITPIVLGPPRYRADLWAAVFPDSKGLNYWININESGENTIKQTAKSFLASEEFLKIYGEQLSNTSFISNLYRNILNREPDYQGLSYWLTQLNNNTEERYEVLLNFSESNENKNNFILETGFTIT